MDNVFFCVFRVLFMFHMILWDAVHWKNIMPSCSFYKEGSPWGRRENVGLILHGKYVF
jgi:hypothetical protein